MVTQLLDGGVRSPTYPSLSMTPWEKGPVVQVRESYHSEMLMMVVAAVVMAMVVILIVMMVSGMVVLGVVMVVMITATFCEAPPLGWVLAHLALFPSTAIQIG